MASLPQNRLSYVPKYRMTNNLHGLTPSRVSFAPFGITTSVSFDATTVLRLSLLIKKLFASDVEF
ncbi:MAG: hypothetical protein H6565_03490 [Lewinellaceae bacterium]|nr:hypothetical protein [Saprospiraceae bacterium]MCB9305639.1 hypothetical protein [Lewinellaceae bacterium]MCB9354116.1 hypothetical protein [Lewinellaceae bacterium]